MLFQQTSSLTAEDSEQQKVVIIYPHQLTSFLTTLDAIIMTDGSLSKAGALPLLCSTSKLVRNWNWMIVGCFVPGYGDVRDVVGNVFSEGLGHCGYFSFRGSVGLLYF